MNKIHLNNLQHQYITNWLKNNKCRPPSAEYIAASRKGEKLTTCNRPGARRVKNFRSEFESGKGVPEGNFNAITDLPPGWALASLWDSAFNHRVVNACDAMMTLIWNHWSGHSISDKPFAPIEGTVDGRDVEQEMKANNLLPK